MLLHYLDISGPVSLSHHSEVSLDRVCGSYQDKKTLLLDTDRSVRFTYKDDRHRNRIKCQLELKLPSKSFGFFILIEELSVISGPDLQSCDQDFLQFGR